MYDVIGVIIYYLKYIIMSVTEPMTTQKMTNEEVANNIRNELNSLEWWARNYINELKTLGNWEAIAQATLAMRHIEDARMRYGKVIQYLGDGVSVYDKREPQQLPQTS